MKQIMKEMKLQNFTDQYKSKQNLYQLTTIVVEQDLAEPMMLVKILFPYNTQLLFISVLKEYLARAFVETNVQSLCFSIDHHLTCIQVGYVVAERTKP